MSLRLRTQGSVLSRVAQKGPMENLGLPLPQITELSEFSRRWVLSITCDRWIVTWCFSPDQPQRVISGQNKVYCYPQQCTHTHTLSKLVLHLISLSVLLILTCYLKHPCIEALSFQIMPMPIHPQLMVTEGTPLWERHSMCPLKSSTARRLTSGQCPTSSCLYTYCP